MRRLGRMALAGVLAGAALVTGAASEAGAGMGPADPITVTLPGTFRDLVVHPTLYEGSSLVTLEGMIHRKPVVASAAGGIPDKVFDERNGFLARPGDADDLAAKIARALDARSAWPAWGDESVRIVRTTFDWPVVARRTLNEYVRMIADQHRHQELRIGDRR